MLVRLISAHRIKLCTPVSVIFQVLGYYITHVNIFGGKTGKTVSRRVSLMHLLIFPFNLNWIIYLVILSHCFTQTLFDSAVSCLFIGAVIGKKDWFTDCYTLSMDFLLLIWFPNGRHFTDRFFVVFESFFFMSLIASFGLAMHVIQPLHSLSNVWLHDTKQRSGFTADPSDELIGWFADWLEPGWKTLAAHLLLNFPVWLCLKVIQESWRRIRATAGHPALMWQRERFAFIRLHVMGPW